MVAPWTAGYQWTPNCPSRSSPRLPAEPLQDRDVAPEPEAVVHDEVRRRLHGLLVDDDADGRGDGERVVTPAHAPGAGRRLVPGLVEQHESCARTQTGEGMASTRTIPTPMWPGCLTPRGARARLVAEAPRPAPDGERLGVRGLAGGQRLLDLLGARAALDVEEVAPGHAAADDGRGRVGRRHGGESSGSVSDGDEGCVPIEWAATTHGPAWWANANRARAPATDLLAIMDAPQPHGRREQHPRRHPPPVGAGDDQPVVLWGRGAMGLFLHEPMPVPEDLRCASCRTYPGWLAIHSPQHVCLCDICRFHGAVCRVCASAQAPAPHGGF